MSVAETVNVDRLADVARSYQEALSLDPDNAVLLHRLGLVMGQLGQRDLELALVGQAIARQPANAGFHADLGLALLDAGASADAEEAFDEALRLAPDQADALAGLGELRLDQGDTAEAASLVASAGARGRRAERVRGRLAATESRWDEAVTHYLAHLRDHPTDATALFYLGVALQAADLLEPASAAYAQAVELEPTLFEAHSNLITALTGLGRAAAAIHYADRAVALAPRRAGAYLNRANARREAGDPAGALGDLTEAVRLDPRYAEAWSTLGNLYHDLRHWSHALDAHRRAMDLAPALAQVRWNRSFTLLASGHLGEGWDEYEWRMATAAARPEPRDSAWPLWQGQPLAGKRIVVWREQGVGDELLFATCVPDLVAAGAAVTLLASPRLLTLLQRSFPDVCVAADGTEPPGEFDYQIGVASLPRWTRRERSAFPANGRYLTADPARRQRWAARLAALGPGRKIGLSWRSGLMTPDRVRHYPDLPSIGGLAEVPGVRWINLQYGDCAGELAALAEAGLEVHQFEDLDLKDDFEETAALVAELDGVVTAATAVSSVAGALGRPTWQLDSGSDWTVFGEDRSPWFPTITVIRQAPGAVDWRGPVAEVRPGLKG